MLITRVYFVLQLFAKPAKEHSAAKTSLQTFRMSCCRISFSMTAILTSHWPARVKKSSAMMQVLGFIYGGTWKSTVITSSKGSSFASALYGMKENQVVVTLIRERQLPHRSGFTAVVRTLIHHEKPILLVDLHKCARVSQECSFTFTNNK